MMSLFTYIHRVLIRKETYYLTDLPVTTESRYNPRQKEEDSLYEVLRKGRQHILIYGPGGTGKTYLARRLFYRLSKEFKYMAWLEYGSDIRVSLSLSSQTDEKEPPDVLFARFIKKLRAHPEETILFIDDVKENAIDDDVLAQLTGLGISILLTSRCASIPPYETWELFPLTIEECTTFFYDNYSHDTERKQEPTVVKIIELLEHNLLSIQLAAQIVGTPDMLHLLAESIAQENQGDRIGKLLGLAEFTESERYALLCLALLPSGEAPDDSKKWFGFSEDALDSLEKKGWISRSCQKDRIVLHDILRDFFFNQGIPSQVIATFLDTVKDNQLLSPDDDQRMLEYKLSAIDRCFALIEQFTPAFACVQLYVSKFLCAARQYDKALDHANSFLAMANDLSCCATDFPIGTFATLGDIYRECGRYIEALRVYKKSVDRYFMLGESEERYIAELYNNMGLVCIYLEKYEEAVAYLEKSLAKKQGYLDEDAPSIATGYTNIGLAYDGLKKYDLALSYHQKAKSIRERKLGKNDLRTAECYSNIGAVFYHSGKYQEAKNYLKEALKLKERMRKKDALAIAASHHNLGANYLRLGELEKASLHIKKALHTRANILGSYHPLTASSYYKYGVVNRKLNRPEDAVKYLVAALRIYRLTLGDKHSETQKTKKMLEDQLKEIYPNEDFDKWIARQPYTMPK